GWAEQVLRRFKDEQLGGEKVRETNPQPIVCQRQFACLHGFSGVVEQDAVASAAVEPAGPEVIALRSRAGETKDAGDDAMSIRSGILQDTVTARIAEVDHRRVVEDLAGPEDRPQMLLIDLDAALQTLAKAGHGLRHGRRAPDH